MSSCAALRKRIEFFLLIGGSYVTEVIVVVLYLTAPRVDRWLQMPREAADERVCPRMEATTGSVTSPAAISQCSSPFTV